MRKEVIIQVLHGVLRGRVHHEAQFRCFHAETFAAVNLLHHLFYLVGIGKGIGHVEEKEVYSRVTNHLHMLFKHVGIAGLVIV